MAQKNIYRGPLTGLNVIDFGHYYAGPLVGMLLADQGANVIHVERPGEPELPSQQYRLFNRNKKLLTLDLKTQESKAQALALIENADVVIENFRPGVMQRLGLDYGNLKKLNPGLVYLSLPGFASNDKNRAHIQAWEGVLGAAACVYTNTSVFRDFLNFPPVYTAVPHCSTYGGVNGAVAIMAALVAREKYGIGTKLEVSLASAGLTAFDAFVYIKPPSWQYRCDPEAKFDLPVAYDGCTYCSEDSPQVSGEKAQRAREAYFKFWGLFKPYKCADGREIYLCPTNSREPCQWAFFEALGIDKQLKQEDFVLAGPYETHLDCNLSLFGLMSNEHKDHVLQLVTEAMASKDADDWEDILSPIISAVKIRTRNEWLTLDAMLNSGVHIKMDNGNSKLTVPGRLVDISEPTDSISNQEMLNNYCEPEAITLDQAKALFSDKVVNTNLDNKTIPLKKGDLLQGLKVLDTARMVAGPSVSMQLAQYGAEVITSTPVEPRHYHQMMAVTNTGKRNIITDVSIAPGREIFRKLVSRSDIVVHNCLDGTAERVGVDHKALQAINPDIVSCQISAFGGTRRGGWERRRGVEQTAQAPTGIMAQYGSIERPQVHGQVSCADTLGGPGGAFAALLGVYQKLKTGYAAETRTSLARMANFIQLPYMIAEKGLSDWGEATGQCAMGEHWRQRLYQCRDGWIYVGASEARSEILMKTVTGQTAPDVQVLEIAFGNESCDYWQNKLETADIGCHQVVNIDTVLDQAEKSSVCNEPAHEVAKGGTEILCWEDHPSGYSFSLLAPDFVRVGEDHSYWRVSPAPRLGEHTREILEELDYSNSEITELIQLKAAHEFFPVMGSKRIYLQGLPVKK